MTATVFAAPKALKEWRNLVVDVRLINGHIPSIAHKPAVFIYHIEDSGLQTNGLVNCKKIHSSIRQPHFYLVRERPGVI